ncbi:hypothetical protein MtrunA17_Chr2g0309031 [Medicago truncatula]|uniref:Transmembrane protein, putative n=1 Tax=Medicago truncatula TaxID=3880 RepID=A0A072V816_MEDTR|nr:transmembrane protein, putative [Medicago truncatula]RHN74323.1 hypothetical protein MtrunA17_Chr2g0309031 [Medicago truncatula]
MGWNPDGYIVSLHNFLNCAWKNIKHFVIWILIWIFLYCHTFFNHDIKLKWLSDWLNWFIIVEKSPTESENEFNSGKHLSTNKPVCRVELDLTKSLRWYQSLSKIHWFTYNQFTRIML